MLLGISAPAGHAVTIVQHEPTHALTPTEKIQAAIDNVTGVTARERDPGVEFAGVEISRHLISAAAILALIVAWEALSYVAPGYAVPHWSRILRSLAEIPMRDVLVTFLRVVGSMLLSFVIGLALSLAMFERPRRQQSNAERIGHVKAPLSVASRRGDTSPIVRQFLKLTKQAARNFRVDDRKASKSSGRLMSLEGLGCVKTLKR